MKYTVAERAIIIAWSELEIEVLHTGSIEASNKLRKLEKEHLDIIKTYVQSSPQCIQDAHPHLL